MSTGNYVRFPAGRLSSSPVRIHSLTGNSYPRSLSAVNPDALLIGKSTRCDDRGGGFVRSSRGGSAAPAVRPTPYFSGSC